MLKTSGPLFEWSLINTYTNIDSTLEDEIQIIENPDNYDIASINNNIEILQDKYDNNIERLQDKYDNNIEILQDKYDNNISSSKLTILDNIYNNINSIYSILEEMELKVTNIEESIKTNRTIILDKDSSATLNDISKNLIDIKSFNKSTNNQLIDKYKETTHDEISSFNTQLKNIKLPIFNIPNTLSRKICFHKNSNPQFL